MDGRHPGYSDGTSLVESADLSLALGAYTTLNLDGGGSTALVVSENGTPTDLNSPSGGMERFDGNSLGVYALPVPEPTSLAIFAVALIGFALSRTRLSS